MKLDWNMCIYKLDPRNKSGRRLISRTTWLDRESSSIDREVKELIAALYPADNEYIFECTPK